MGHSSLVRDVPDSASLKAAYAHCQALARDHYENFPVASLILPKRHRPSIAAVYAFARIADDMADEGSDTPEERLRKLDGWEEQLTRSAQGSAVHPVFIALADTMQRYAIPQQLFSDLLSAFRQDVTRQRYATFTDVFDYCRRSANPVGRIVLHVFGEASPQKLAWSDDICTALQLTNFWQDISVDVTRNRIYLPLEDLARFQYNESELLALTESDRFCDLMRFEVRRTRGLFNDGRRLISATAWPLSLELAVTCNGGMKILDLIDRSNYAVLRQRPFLQWKDKLSVLLSSLFVSVP